jgi:enterochelin esterase-like enzyme
VIASILCALAVETLSLTSRVFHNTRTIRVLVPDGYGDPANASRKYPVMYLNDGQMVFRPLEREGIEIQSLPIPPIIIVGMDSAGEQRANEYQGKLYPSFLVEEVMPLVASKYRVADGPANTGVGGFSYGGVAALHAVIARPGVFGRLLIESTPLENDDLSKDAAWPSRIFIGGGTSEPEVVNLKDYEAFAAIVRRSAQVKYVVEPGARHATSFWRGRLPGALDFLFTSPRQR